MKITSQYMWGMRTQANSEMAKESIQVPLHVPHLAMSTVTQPEDEIKILKIKSLPPKTDRDLVTIS